MFRLLVSMVADAEVKVTSTICSFVIPFSLIYSAMFELISAWHVLLPSNRGPLAVSTVLIVNSLLLFASGEHATMSDNKLKQRMDVCSNFIFIFEYTSKSIQ
jgi:hypothetical protein